MPVEAVVIRASPAMLHHDILAVVRVTGHEVDVSDCAQRNRANRIQRFSAFVTLHWTNIDALMESRVDQPAGGLERISHKPILAALPWRRLHALKITGDVLVERGAAAIEERVIVGWQREAQTRFRTLRDDMNGRHEECGSPAHKRDPSSFSSSS